MKNRIPVPYIETKFPEIPEVESRTQGSRPRTQKNPRPRPRTAFPRTDTLEAKDRNARGQGHKRKCSPKKKKGLHKNFSGELKKKKVFTKIFQAFSTKKRFPKNFSSAPQNFNCSKNSAVLEAKAKDFKMCPRELHLCEIHIKVFI